MGLKYRDRGCQDLEVSPTGEHRDWEGSPTGVHRDAGGLSYRDTDVWKLSIFVLNLHIFP